MRLSKKVVYPDKPQLGMVDCWYHPKCFVQKREELGFRPEFSASQLMGFSCLTAEDQEALKKQLPEIKGERWVEGWGGGCPWGFREEFHTGPESASDHCTLLAAPSEHSPDWSPPPPFLSPLHDPLTSPWHPQV